MKQLQKNGWIEIDYSNYDEDLINIAKEFGTIINHPNGSIIDYIRPKKKTEALKNTLSYNFEYKEFPLHTDTAFWEIPSRYVLLSCENYSSTATTIIKSEELINLLSIKELSEFKNSIFLVKTQNSNFYTSILSIICNIKCFRFDSNCMRPLNNSAKISEEIIKEKIQLIEVTRIIWNNPKILIFDNWSTLHGRDEVVNDEKRIIKRIYIK